VKSPTEFGEYVTNGDEKMKYNKVEIEVRGGVVIPIKMPSGIELVINDMDVGETETYKGPQPM